MVFAFLFGVSMDYEVFIISRMREAYDRTARPRRAVVEGIGRTGRLVTSAALILGLAFVALSASPGTEIKIFATALGGRHPARRHDRPRACSCPPSCRSSAAGTGGCRAGRRDAASPAVGAVIKR